MLNYVPLPHDGSLESLGVPLALNTGDRRRKYVGHAASRKASQQVAQLTSNDILNKNLRRFKWQKFMDLPQTRRFQRVKASGGFLRSSFSDVELVVQGRRRKIVELQLLITHLMTKNLLELLYLYNINYYLLKWRRFWDLIPGRDRVCWT